MARPRNDRNEAWVAKVRERRLTHGWSQRELAESMGHSFRYIERIEQEVIVPPAAERRRLERKLQITAAESAALRGTTLSDAFETLRQVQVALYLARYRDTGKVAAEMAVTLHNPSDFKLRFEATLDGWVNERMHGALQTDGYAEPNSDLVLRYTRLHDVTLQRKKHVRDPYFLALLDYDILYHPVFDASVKATKGARARMVVWHWPFEDHYDGELKFKGYWDDEFEEWQLADLDA